ncbi:hypothetical protein [Leptotrichia massiliensis]|uniref:hypothetical protein n=1 Tax=Leptotrichia massiliensis TaxID=1852388 RepID=UPI0028D18F2C|nr:hypothetical protein [Leptotrichia massiliensis]
MYSKNKIKWKILVFFLLFYIISYSTEIFFINNNAFSLTVKTEKAENVKITDKELENDEFLIVENLKKYFEKEIKNKKIKKIPKKDFQVQGSFLIKIKFVDIDEAIVEIESNGFEATNSDLVKLKYRKKDRIWEKI